MAAPVLSSVVSNLPLVKESAAMDGAVVGAVVVVVCVLLVLRSGMRVVNQVDRGVVFRFGKALPGHRQPGITFLIPFADRMRKVNVRTYRW